MRTAGASIITAAKAIQLIRYAELAGAIQQGFLRAVGVECKGYLTMR
jgi:hypothetical protein